MADRKDDDSKMLRMPKQKKRPGAVWAVLILLVTASCDNETSVDEVADWGGGTQSPYVPMGYKLAFEDNLIVSTLRMKSDRSLTVMISRRRGGKPILPAGMFVT